MHEFELTKHDIHPDELLKFDESTLVGNTLKNRGRILINTDLQPAKNDYIGNNDRGTVYYNELSCNYSFHKVIIPDNTIIKESNFMQYRAGTKAIFGKNLTFIECNLVNNTIDETWTLKSCNISQIELRGAN